MREIDQLKDVAIKNNAGFFVGPVMDIKIPLLGFGADIALQYSYNSYTIETPEMRDRKSKQHMFEIPVHLKYNFDLGSILGLYVAAGPSFGFNINPDSFWKDLTIAVADEIDGNHTYKRNSTEVYLDFGAGLTILSKVQLGFTYNLGLTDAAKGRGVGGVVREAWGHLHLLTDSRSCRHTDDRRNNPAAAVPDDRFRGRGGRSFFCPNAHRAAAVTDAKPRTCLANLHKAAHKTGLDRT